MAVQLAKDDQVLFTKLLLTRSYKTKLGCRDCVDVGVSGSWWETIRLCMAICLAPLQEDPLAGLDFGELNITSQDDDILDEAAGGYGMWHTLPTITCKGLV